MLNTDLLRSAIKCSGLKAGYVSESLGMSRATFISRMKRRTEFSLSEVTWLRNALNMDDATFEAIFFAAEVE